MKKRIRRALRIGLFVLVFVTALALLAYWVWFRNPYHENLRLRAATVMTLPADRHGLLIQNVNLVDVDRGIVVPEVTVRVLGETIDEVFIGKIPKAEPGLDVIDARGKYLMPGLFETHAHLGNGGIAPLEELESEVALEQFVLYGVTAILSVGGTGGNNEQIAEFKRRERSVASLHASELLEQRGRQCHREQERREPGWPLRCALLRLGGHVLVRVGQSRS